MKKKLTIVATIFIACTITINTISNNKENNIQEEMLVVRKQEKILSYYKENDNGEYELATDTAWPIDGYTFNTELSKCENGSELSWNSENNTVIIMGNTSDKCYIYFDINKSKPKITGVSNIYGDASNSEGFVFDVTYESEVSISKVFVIYESGKVREGTFDNNGEYLSVTFRDEYDICNSTNYQVYIVDTNGTKSDNFSFQYIYTCFPAGTRILTKYGYKNIEDIKINDIVYSFNEKINKVELKTVVKTFIHEDAEIYEIYINDEIIKVTPHHRFYIKRNNKFEWIEVKDILLTDKLFDNENKLITINKIEYKKETNIVYNFEVQNNHTYFVSNKNILVHNAKTPCV